MMKKFLLLLSMVLLAVGCSTVSNTVGGAYHSSKQFVGLEDPPKPPPMVDGEPMVRFSETNYRPTGTPREYHRMTRQKMEEESQLQGSAGSMWVMEGQGAYLFSQNKTRREGDVLNVKIEGPAQHEVATSTNTIICTSHISANNNQPYSRTTEHPSPQSLT